MQLALEAIHGVTAGVGGKNGQCTLCHVSSAGGPGNINGSFGQDFKNTALDIIGTSGGNDLPPTGFNSLETIFSDPDFAARDSDRDGRSNASEFASNDDPANDISNSPGSSGGGGCGMIGPTSNSGPSSPHLLLLALPLVALLKRKGMGLCLNKY